ncbi:hypothetical protein [Kordia zhangzhouensis]|uniref:hypothetical protein n=1 Tax=Kordia zhangzhouensis TaxID=1620405 RepID=UPI000629A66A|nr:hypothetical protein [Kordia zhangzhouensis]
MKKRALKNLALNKKCISTLENKVVGGAIKTIDGCANTGCVGPVQHTCGIINCNLTKEES